MREKMRLRGGKIDAQKGYAYFGSWATAIGPVIPQILKIKLTPGTNAPIRIGVVNLGATPVPVWTSSIDTLHGYVYYATDNGTTNIPETVFKVKLGDGDSLPAPVAFRRREPAHERSANHIECD